MESVKTQLSEITAHFNTRMAEFQKELKGSIPATSPSSNINAQFSAFRAFVLTALENIQLQVELLARQQDELEMRSRRKILLVHGIAEVDKENLGLSMSKVLSERLGIAELTSDSFSRCHRLGRSSRTDGKPRAVLIKFKDVVYRDKVWALKSKLKGSGVTLSEFLNKSRHKTFMEARNRFGVAKSWTKGGSIEVIDPNGKRHRITTIAELNTIPTSVQVVPRPTEAFVSDPSLKEPKVASSQRPRRAASSQRPKK